MSTHNKKVSETIADSLDLPKDVVLGLPLISTCGDREIYIDNHLGILSYQSNLIVIKSKLFPIRIEGRNLVIDFYTRDSVKIIGQITSICFLS